MKKLAAFISCALLLSAFTSCETVVERERVYVPVQSGNNSARKSNPSFRGDPAREGKRDPGSVEPVRTPSTYSR